MHWMRIGAYALYFGGRMEVSKGFGRCEVNKNSNIKFDF